jgi:ribosomal protein S18 acetylase RimI-like enzyme
MMRQGRTLREPSSRAGPAAAPSVRVASLSRRERPGVEVILRATGVFREDEITVAMEVLDAYLENPEQDYSALGAFTQSGRLLGYVCYGPTPLTQGTCDLYWIAVSPEAHGRGVGTRLLQEVERRLARSGARLVIIETSSQPAYQPTRAFYERRGYHEVARVPDFYAPGDDRVIFARTLESSTDRTK